MEELITITVDIRQAIQDQKLEYLVTGDVEDEIEELLEREGIGLLDGHEASDSHYRMFLYGLNACAIVRIIAPILQRTPGFKNAKITRTRNDGTVETLT